MALRGSERETIMRPISKERKRIVGYAYRIRRAAFWGLCSAAERPPASLPAGSKMADRSCDGLVPFSSRGAGQFVIQLPALFLRQRLEIAALFHGA